MAEKDSGLPRVDALYRLAIESAPIAILVVDDVGQIVLVNEETEKLLGYSDSELLGKPIDRLIPERYHTRHPDQRLMFLTAFSAPEARPMGKMRDLFFVRKDGTELPIEIGLNAIESSAGLLVIAAVIDLTERKRAEGKFEAAVESSPSGVLMVDADGVMVLANPKAASTFGYERDELLGQPLEMLVPERFRDAHPDHRYSYMAAPEARPMGSGRELFGVHKDGSEIPLEVGLTPITAEEGTFVLASVVDITLRRAVETQLLEAQRLETIGTLASGIAHDFNNLLLAILGYAELVLKNPRLERNAQRYMSQVITAAERGRQMVERMMMMGRKRSEVAAATPLHGPIAEALDLLQASVLKSIEVRRHLDETTPAVVCEGTQIYQIVMNLCSNAAGAMAGSDGTLELSLVPFTVDERVALAHPGLKTGLYARLTVRDNGLGMTPEVAERIYEPFFTTGRSDEGTGLGLWLVQETVSALKGVIELDTQEGAGTVFDIFLPAAAEQEDLGETETDIRKHILFVDDELPLAELGRHRLEAEGYRVTVFSSSVRALEYMRNRPNCFDLLVTDNTMPRLSGLELAEEAVRIRPDLPVLMASGLARLRLEDVPAFITRVLPKPHTSDELAKAVAELLGARPPDPTS